MQFKRQLIKHLEISVIRYQLVKDAAHKKEGQTDLSSGTSLFTVHAHQAMFMDGVL